MILLNTVGATQWLAAGGSEGDRALSWADGLYLSGAVPAGLALVRYPMASGLRRAWRPLVLDGLVVGSSILLLSAMLGLSEVAGNLTGSRAFVFLVYPVMDVAILSLIVVLLLRSAGGVRVDVVLIAITFAVFAGRRPGLRAEQRARPAARPRLPPGVRRRRAAAGQRRAGRPPPWRAAYARCGPTCRGLSPRSCPTSPPSWPSAPASSPASPVVVRRVLVTVVLVLTGLRQLLLTATNLRLRHSLELRVAERTEELRLLTEEHERLDAMKRELVSAVSHELRTPLTAIRGSLELLADGDAGELPAARPTRGRDGHPRQPAAVAARRRHHRPGAARERHLRLPPRAPRPRAAGARRRRLAERPGARGRRGRGRLRRPRGRRVRRGPRHPGPGQPARQRLEVHPGRRHGHWSAPHAGARRCRSPSPTPGAASRPRTCSRSSTASTRSSPTTPASSRARASAWPSPAASSWPTVVASGPRARRARARRSTSPCPWPPPLPTPVAAPATRADDRLLAQPRTA